MNVSFQYANRHNTSVLLKIDGVLANQTICLLVDAGEGVDVDSLIDNDENEYLTGILLTHLHLDHYDTLDENLRDGARIYTSEENEKLLDTVLSEANTNDGQSFDTQTVRSAVEPVGDGVTIGDNLTIKTAPAGHTPGATAFYLELETDSGTETILITGDFTRRKVAGYPGLSLHDADTVVLTGATSNKFENSITDAIDNAVQQGVSGSPTLVTAAGLNSVHAAYLLGHTLEETSQSLRVNIVGQAAKLYDALDYDVPHVNSIQEYDPSDVVDAGCITISGPDVPNSGGSKLLFDEIRDDPNAGLIQLIGSNQGEIADSRCTTNQYEFVNHPTMETIEDTLELLNPKQIVVTHQTGSDLERYRDQFSTVVWAPKSNNEFTLYEGGVWSPPHWVSDGVIKTFREDASEVTLSAVDSSSRSFERTGVDLEAEGVHVDQLALLSEGTSECKYSTSPSSSSPSDSGNEDGRASPPASTPEKRAMADGAAARPAGEGPGGIGEETDVAVTGIEGAIMEIQSSLDRIEDDLVADSGVDATAVHTDGNTVVLEVEDDCELPDEGDSVVLQQATS
jgi:putative mRNA 3-end processing factor